MRVSLKQLERVNNWLQSQLKDAEAKANSSVEMSCREEDFSNGTVMSCVTLVMCYEKKPENYDPWVGPKVVKITVELYPDSENRLPRITAEENFELKPSAY